MGDTKVTPAELQGGVVYARQGGDPDDFSVPGTTDYSEDKASILTQIGAATSASSEVTVTFKTPYATKPHVMLSIVSSTFSMPVMTTVTTTGFTFKVGNLLGNLLPNIQVNWVARGRR